MSQSATPLENALEALLRRVVREEIRAANGDKGPDELLSPEELAARLKVPPTWVYEQSRQGKIPVHRVGRYIRFNLAEVLASQKNK